MNVITISNLQELIESFNINNKGDISITFDIETCEDLIILLQEELSKHG